MDSAHGTKTVRLQRKKNGLGFSVKGGHEHGIPIVVSSIKDDGAAGKGTSVAGDANTQLSCSSFPFSRYVAKHLRLGDVILAVNGRSLQGASHSEAVLRLKQAGATVLLRIKPNQVLEGKD